MRFNYNAEKKSDSATHDRRKNSRVESIHNKIDNNREKTGTSKLVEACAEKLRTAPNQKTPTFDVIVDKLESKGYNFLELMDLYDQNIESDKLEQLCGGYDPITIMALMKINFESKRAEAA